MKSHVVFVDLVSNDLRLVFKDQVIQSPSRTIKRKTKTTTIRFSGCTTLGDELCLYKFKKLDETKIKYEN